LALLPKISVADCLELSLPSRQHGLIKRADEFFSHCIAPNSDSPVVVSDWQNF
jgi:hypothetical protein